MARKEKEVPIQQWQQFYNTFMRAPLQRTLCAYVYCEAPPFAADAGGTPDLARWVPAHADNTSWLTDMAETPEERALTERMDTVLREYESRGVSLLGSWRSATQVTITVFDEGATPEPAPMVFHQQQARSRLPRPADAQFAFGSFADACTANFVSDTESPGLVALRESYPDRQRALVAWGKRVLARRQEAVQTFMFFDAIGARTNMGTAAVLAQFPWLDDIGRAWSSTFHTNLRQAAVSHRAYTTDFVGTIPFRHAYSFEAGYEPFASPERAMLVLAPVFDMVRQTFLKAVAAHRAWTENHPQQPWAVLVPCAEPDKPPRWLHAWYAMFGTAGSCSTRPATQAVMCQGVEPLR